MQPTANAPTAGRPVPDQQRRWCKRFGRRVEPAEIRLLCFHHAGGNASIYRHWPSLVPGYVEPVAIQLPGRADRFLEPAYEHMDPLVADLIDVLEPLLDRPFACYGTSMGARVAWALVHQLRARALPLPRALFVAAHAPPHLDDGYWDWDNWGDDEEDLLRYVERLGGTPPELLAEPELLRAFLSTLAADLSVLRTHTALPSEPLDLPIHAFVGADDFTVSTERMLAWRPETTARFDLDVVTGGHFFDRDGERQVIQAIGRDLT